ncbi:MAG: cation transporter [Fidelibacterota bacterium]|nr:MAG: cation transporter [Candidatus Neomarinimicrobiota bacterium]
MKKAFLSELILKATVPEYQDTADPVVRTRIGQLEAWVSILVNGLLSAVKLALGVMVNSLALIADGVHTLSDMATSAVVLFGFKISGKPADKEHPFGHGRVEYVTTLIIAVMLAVIGYEFIKSAIGRLIEPVPVAAGWGILSAIFLTLLVKAWLGQFSMLLGLRIDSLTLKADAWHHRSDAISSLLVLAAVGGSSLGYPALDGVGGILVGAYLIWSGFVIAKGVIDPLLGQPPPPELVGRIRELCRGQEQVIDVHDITVHDYGHHRFMALHVEVSDRLSAQKSHDVAEGIQDLLRQELGAYATVHTDPIDLESEVVHQVSSLLDDLVPRSDTFTGYHDLRVVNTPEYEVILFDMVVSPDAGAVKRQATRRWVQRELIKDFPNARVSIHVSPPHAYG